MKTLKLTTIVASAIIAVAPLISGCHSKNIPVYGPADPNGNRQVIGHYKSRGFSVGVDIDTYESQEKKPVYGPNSQ